MEKPERIGPDLAAVLVGAGVGLVGTVFREGARRGYEIFGELLGAADARGIPGWIPGVLGGALLVAASVSLTRRFAREASGSGIQEVEGVLAGEIPELRWRRVLPVKFVGGLLALTSGLLLGREGPTIHMGAGVAAAVGESVRASREKRHLLVGAGAAAGLAVAFRAPFAGILFALEELRREFPPTRESIRAVALATLTAVVVGIALAGSTPMLPVAAVRSPTALELGLVVPFAMVVAVLGLAFNAALLATLETARAIARRAGWLPLALLVGGGVGALVWIAPPWTGGGEDLAQRLVAAPPAAGFLLLLLVGRFLLFDASYATGVPGGIFAPQIALGACAGLLAVVAGAKLAPTQPFSIVLWSIAGMAALLAATVRAPLTGLALVIEMTGCFPAGLMALLAAVTADVTARVLGGRPIYEAVLERQLAAEKNDRAAP
ncbi:MAG TPA: H(+)/Cl(-) exchange transporter ClcA [Thermoanaerobaculia bacterium]|nr:H(+)/Cl(-) exchange transporter ClcA [Thermoanaerobaculia bacterium]